MASLLLAILLISSAAASPFSKQAASSFRIASSLSLKTVLNSAGGLAGLKQSDLARVKAYRARHQASSGSKFADTLLPVSNIGPLLTAEVGVGSPPTTYQLIVDTGSSNTFVGASKKYEPTSSSQNTKDSVSVSYGSGFFAGTEFIDTVTLGNLSIKTQSIGVAEQSEGLQPLDGILGLGPNGLTEGTVQNTDIIPTVTDNLAQQGTIPNNLVGLFLPPTTGDGSDGGSLDFGTPDSSKYNGEMKFAPITQAEPSSEFWGIDQSISYGDNNTSILSSNPGIVDSGTTLTFIASDAFEAYTKATGATEDQATGLLKVDSVDQLQSLFFNIGGNTFEFTANAQIWPRSLNVDMGGDPNATYLIVADMGAPSGQGMDFINGFTFLQRFYSAFDTTNRQVGLATTPFTNATSN